MKKFLSIDELLKEAKKKGVDFGKGDPYNRLRYYTKINWIPHMTRKKDEEGYTKGHYPTSTVDRLVNIQKLKDLGLSNDEISRKLALREKTKNLYAALGSEDLRNRLILYGTFIMIVIILAAELGIINIGERKSSQLVLQNSQGATQSIQIVDSGSAFIPEDEDDLFVDSEDVTVNSKIYVSFKEDYSPATKFWVSEQKQGEGFTIELDVSTSSNAEFDWWITN